MFTSVYSQSETAFGQSEIALTMNTYPHVLPRLQREAADKMNGALTGTSAAGEGPTAGERVPIHQCRRALPLLCLWLGGRDSNPD